MANVERRGNNYRITVSAGFDSNNKQIRVKMTWKPDPGMTERQIQKELDRQTVLFEESVRSGQYTNGNIKFKDFAERWFRDYAKDHLRQRTYCEYRKTTKRIYAAIGHIRLDRLQPHHLLAFYKQLEECDSFVAVRYVVHGDLKAIISGQGVTIDSFAKIAGVSVSTLKSALAGKNVSAQSANLICAAAEQPITTIFQEVRGEPKKLAPKTILHYHTVISSILERAVKWQIIRENPCRRIDPPKVPRHEIDHLDDEEAVKFLDALSDESIENQTMFSLLLYVGLRRGELLGLEWTDINFENGVISVRRTSQYDPSLGVFEDTTKTEQSKRSIRITDSLLQLLKAHRAAQAAMKLQAGDRWSSEWTNHPRLFTNLKGEPMSPSTPLNRLKCILRRSGLPDVSLHSLRHTNATLLIGQGVDIRTVSGRLGHSQTSTTINIYTHELKSADAAAAAALDLVLGKGRNKA